MARYAVSVDIGGTFTDFVLQDRERRIVLTEKVLTTSARPEDAIFRGIGIISERSNLNLGAADLFLHATTLITNAVIERKGRRFILLHTQGFRDVFEIAREQRYNLTNLKLRFPQPVSERGLRIAVEERVSALGEVEVAPERDRVLAAVEPLVEAEGVLNFAVCFLHSYRNGQNEDLVANWLQTRYPEAHVSVSAIVAPAQREYERWTTCAINAYTRPLLGEYIARLQDGLSDRGFAGRALMMTSSGLPMDFEQSTQFPVRLIESGPAAGVLAAKEIAERNASPAADGAAASPSEILAFDMGGTTAKGAFLTAGAFHVQRSLEVARVGAFEAGSGFPLMIPAIDLIEIGAGGGSIAEIDGRGVISVGPQSAGADPGPACYDRGGTAATVTDANIVLGLLDENNFRNSGIDVRAELAAQAMEASIAAKLGISVERAAIGIHETVNEDVARAFRVHAAELGIDYRRYTLICTGGSAPLHAAAIARILNIRHVLYPFGAGVSSAFGLFAGHEGITLQKTKVIPLEEVTPALFRAELDDLMASQRYASALVESHAVAELTLDMRYVGQGYEVSVKLGADFEACSQEAIREAFEREYRKIFGLIFPTYQIEIFNWTLEIMKRDPIGRTRGFAYERARAEGERCKGTRTVRLGRSAAEVAVYDRYVLQAGDRIIGAALVEEHDATIYLPPYASGIVQPSLDILATIES